MIERLLGSAVVAIFALVGVLMMRIYLGKRKIRSDFGYAMQVVAKEAVRRAQAEHRVVLAQLIVDAPDALAFVAVVRRRVRNLAARIRRGGQTPRQVHPGRAEERGIDAVAGEPAARKTLLITNLGIIAPCWEPPNPYSKGDSKGLQS